MPGTFGTMDYHDALRLVMALVFGGLIGFERRWHGHAAGPHTNALVAFGAALFTMIGVQFGDNSSGRVIAQIATGVGFLGGGVILRDGLRVRGLNTAATVWCVAAIGAFAAVGYMWLAAVATLIVVVSNTGFHILEHNVPRLREVSEEDREEEKGDGGGPQRGGLA